MGKLHTSLEYGLAISGLLTQMLEASPTPKLVLTCLRIGKDVAGVLLKHLFSSPAIKPAATTQEPTAPKE